MNQRHPALFVCAQRHASWTFPTLFTFLLLPVSDTRVVIRYLSIEQVQLLFQPQNPNFIDEDIYKVEVPEGKDAKAESKKKKKEVGSENRRSKEDKPRITIDVLTSIVYYDHILL